MVHFIKLRLNFLMIKYPIPWLFKLLIVIKQIIFRYFSYLEATIWFGLLLNISVSCPFLKSLFLSLLGSAVISIPQIKCSVSSLSLTVQTFLSLPGFWRVSWRLLFPLMSILSGITPLPQWSAGLCSRVLFYDGPCLTFFNSPEMPPTQDCWMEAQKSTDNKQLKIKIQCFLKLDFPSFLDHCHVEKSRLPSSGSHVPLPQWPPLSTKPSLPSCYFSSSLRGPISTPHQDLNFP